MNEATAAMRHSLGAPERVSAILAALAQGSVSVSQLASELAVSEATIRRDLDDLERQHLLTRTHGGAVRRELAYELPLRYTGGSNHAEKLRIAAAAASRVPVGAAVGLTGGTTTTEVARALWERTPLTIVTNALNIAAEVAIRPGIRLVLAGGVVRPESYEAVGPLADATLRELNLDIVFVGVGGVAADAGLTTDDEIEAHTNRTMIERARRVIVVTHCDKIGRAALAQICPIGVVHELITVAGGDRDQAGAIEDAGVTVTRV